MLDCIFRCLMEVIQGATELARPRSSLPPGIVVERIIWIEVDGAVVLLDCAFKVARAHVDISCSDEGRTFVHLGFAKSSDRAPRTL